MLGSIMGWMRHLPKDEIYGPGMNATERALFMNEILQVVDVNVERGSNCEWRRISLDKTPKRNVRHSRCSDLAKLAFLRHAGGWKAWRRFLSNSHGGS